MKNFNKIFISMFAFVALLSCEQQTTTTTPGGSDTEIDVEMPQYGYIFFDTEQATRANLWDGGRLTADFSVLGYRYLRNWETAKAQVSQTMVWSNGVNAGVFLGEEENNTTPKDQRVRYDSENNSHSYEPLRPWEANMNYAFFAWYPFDLEANGGSVSTHIGNPYITYNLNLGSNLNNVGREYRAGNMDKGGSIRGMADVMTACEIDYSKAKGLSVPLKMEHRLAALDIRAMHVITPQGLNELWYGKNKHFTDDAEVLVAIDQLTLKIESINTSVRIPLNTVKDANGNVEAIIPSNPTRDVTFTGFDGATGIPNYNTSGVIKELVGADEKMILIPQSNEVKVWLSLRYKITCNGESAPNPEDEYDTYTTPINYPITFASLDEGVLHYLLVTISKTGVSIQATAVQGWTSIDVPHEFN